MCIFKFLTTRKGMGIRLRKQRFGSFACKERPNPELEACLGQELGATVPN
ncbi:MAG: hypothetical protein L7W39_00245 [Alphaproteobacteria bacterium]|nr:hypothetical protein [Alphaproteobacteria bacterium]